MGAQSERRVALFGGGDWGRDDERWSDGERIGACAARAGFAVVTGGYGGAMACVSKGALEAGGRTIGVLHTPPEEKAPNPYVQERIVVRDYMARMAELLRVPYAIALPGASGTLAEVSASIALLQRYGERRLALWSPLWLDKLSACCGELFDEFTLSRLTVLNTVEDVRDWLEAL